MNELYELIEKKKGIGISNVRFPGADVYDDICDQIDGKMGHISAAFEI